MKKELAKPGLSLNNKPILPEQGEAIATLS